MHWPLTLILSFVLHLRLSEGMVRINGQSCEDGEPCLGAHVTCLATGVCGCSSVDDMIYDHSVRDCVAKLGKRCGVDSECIEGALCVKGICRCEYGFYASSDGICLPMKGYREPCTGDVECGLRKKKIIGNSTHRALICLDGLCQCDRKVDVFSKSKGSCVGLVDSECSGGDDCTENADCKKGPTGKSICQCGSRFDKTSQGLCGLAFGQNCVSNTCADIHLMCIDGKCSCKYPLHQVYDERLKECLSLVSGPCTFPRNIQMNLSSINDFQRCIKNAQCVDKGFYSECECKKRFQPTQTGACAPGYRQPCEPGTCDPDGLSQLYCRNGVCDCSDLLQVFDPILKKCRGLVGARCSPKLPFCVEHASCVIADQNLPGKCLCDNNSKEIHNRTCDYKIATP